MLSNSAAKSAFLGAPELTQLANVGRRFFQLGYVGKWNWKYFAATPARDGNPKVIGDSFRQAELEQSNVQR